MSEILILKAQDICFGILDSVAENFGNEIRRKNIDVVYFDVKKEAPETLEKFLGRPLLAVIDIYSGLISSKAEGNILFWDSFQVPVFQVVLDYPMYIEHMLGYKLQKYYPLCMDRKYCEGFTRYYREKITPFFFPMTGRASESGYRPWKDRGKEIVFIANYVDHKDFLSIFYENHGNLKEIGNQYFNTLIGHPELNQAQALELVMDGLGMEKEPESFRRIFILLKHVAKAATYYYREKVIEVLLAAGFRVEVFSDSWKASRLTEYDNLILHPQVEEDEYIEVMGDAKVAVNLLYGNKAGFTERYGYGILNGAITVTDESEYLREEFTDMEDIVFYDLKHLEELSEKVRWLFLHEEEAGRISERAYTKAFERHTWENRVNVFFEYILQVYGEN